MTPLQTWTCDSCGQEIESADAGIVVWRYSKTESSHDFRIVHKRFSGEPNEKNCDPGSAAGYVANLDLPLFLGSDGLTMLLSWLSDGPLRGGGNPDIDAAGLDEYVDLVRRTQIPYYEEARSRFRDDLTLGVLNDANQYFPYIPETLKRIADGTLGR